MFQFDISSVHESGCAALKSHLFGSKSDQAHQNLPDSERAVLKRYGGR